MTKYNVPAGSVNKKASETSEITASKKRKLEEISHSSSLTEKKKEVIDNQESLQSSVYYDAKSRQSAGSSLNESNYQSVANTSSNNDSETNSPP